MMKRVLVFLAAMVAFVLPVSAHADEVFGGIYVHGVDTPFTLETGEGGASVQLGYRFGPIEEALEVEPYVIGSFNTEGDTSFAGIGISRKFDLGVVYLRPGVGLVIHDGPSVRTDPVSGDRTELGSRVLFEPEIAIGTQVSERLSLEASWVHVSHARLFNSEQNPGLDLLGVRLNLQL